MSKIIIGLVAYVILTFVIAYSWNMVLFRENYLALASSSLRSAPIIQLGLITILLEGLALSIIFSIYYKGGNPLTEGLLLGLLVGIFSVAYAGLTVPAKFVIDPIWKYTILELSFGIIHFGLAGIILGFIFNRTSQ
jgi:hypothetical protein